MKSFFFQRFVESNYFDQVIESHAIQVNDESVVESRARLAAPGRRARNESDDDLFTSARAARA